jgi:FlaA1/EpsC-like NDP-sugar epimerase
MRNRYILVIDLPLIAIAAFGAFALRFDWLFASYRPEFFSFVVAALAIKPVVFYIFGMYTRYWRYATANDLLAVSLAVSAASVVMAAYVGVGRAFGVVGDFSRPVLLIDWLLSMVVVGGLRMSVRVIGEAHDRGRRSSTAAPGKRVLVVGAGEAGTMVVREMQRNPQLKMFPIGFLDDDGRKHGKRIYGTVVLGPTTSVQRMAKVRRLDEVVIAMPRASGAVVRAVVKDCQAAGIKCRTIPGVFELLDGHVSISRLREVEITDLLRRSEIHMTAGAEEYVRGRTVLVTGAGGSIGCELARQVAHANPRAIILLGHGENSIFDAYAEINRVFPHISLRPVIADIRDRARLGRVMRRLAPEIVFHAAAHKHVPLMEENPEEAISNNVIGTANVVDAALSIDVERLVMISTDKAVAPRNLMGASKRMAELIVRDAARRTGRAFVVVRFGNVLGSRGSVVPIFKRQIELGGPLTVTHPDMRRFFMTIPEAVHLVIQAGGRGRGGELFVLKMGQPMRIVDLAEDLIRLSGFQLSEIPIVFVGLRPGEKLDENLWEADATVEAIDHPDLLRIIEPNDPSSSMLAVTLETLRDAAAEDSRPQIEAALATCIASFVPSATGRSPVRTAIVH